MGRESGGVSTEPPTLHSQRCTHTALRVCWSLPICLSDLHVAFNQFLLLLDNKGVFCTLWVNDPKTGIAVAELGWCGSSVSVAPAGWLRSNFSVIFRSVCNASRSASRLSNGLCLTGPRVINFAASAFLKAGHFPVPWAGRILLQQEPLAGFRDIISGSL